MASSTSKRKGHKNQGRKSGHSVSVPESKSKTEAVLAQSKTEAALAQPPAFERELKCSVCLDLYEDPILLPCLHSYCTKCLDGISKDKTKSSLLCPQCRTSHIIPRDGISGFPYDQELANEVQAHVLKSGEPNVKQTVSKTQQCNMCTEDDPAISYCTTCGKHLCDFCHKAHKRQVDFRSHKVTLLSEISPEGMLALEKPVHCRYHAGELLKLYCKTCEKLICRDCTIVEHRNHEYGFNSDLRPKVQKEVRSTIALLKHKLAAFKKHKSFLTVFEKEQEAYCTKLETEVTTTFNGYIKQYEAQRDKLLEKIQESKHKDMKKVWTEKQFVETTLAGIESAMRYADRLCACSSDTLMLAMRSEASTQFKNSAAAKWDSTKLDVSKPLVFSTNTPNVESSGKVTEVTQQDVSVSIYKNGAPQTSYEEQMDTYAPSFHNVPGQRYGVTQLDEITTLGNLPMRLTVKIDCTRPLPCIIPSVSMTLHNNYTGSTSQSQNFVCTYVAKGEWMLEIFLTICGQYSVNVTAYAASTPTTQYPAQTHKYSAVYPAQQYSAVYQAGYHGSSQVYQGSSTYIILVTGVPVVGSRVCRGPDWKHGDEDGGIGSKGTVIETQIQDTNRGGLYGYTYNKPMQDVGVHVKWDKSGKTSVYKFSESHGFEIELVGHQ